MARLTTILRAAGRRWLPCAAVVGLAACGSTGSGAPDAGGQSPAATPQQCAIVSSRPLPDPPHSLTVLVADNTASGPVATGTLPGSVTAALRQAQAKNGELVILGVNGTGGNPILIKETALDPAPGHDSRDADNARATAISCVELWISSGAAMPVRPGSDILGTVDAAIRRAPTQIIVMSDGLNNVDPLNLNTIGYGTNPDSVVTSLQATKSIDHAARPTSVLWADLGVTSRPIPDAVRASVKMLWAAILHAAGLSVTFAPEETQAGPLPPHAPADNVNLPKVTSAVTSCHATFTIPTDLLFLPGDDHLIAPPGVLAEARSELSEPGASAVISGHTAAYGSIAYRHDLSVARAKAVALALETEGVPKSRLTIIGYGSTRPAENEFPGGRHDLAAAAANRRVVIDVTRGGCA